MKETVSCLLLLMLIKSSQPFNVWSDWTAYSSCTPECQIGTQTRTRTCVSAPCAGDSIETMSCNTLCGCQTNPCNNGGTCIQNVNDPKVYECFCAPGYYGINSQNCDNQTQNENPYAIDREFPITSPSYPGQYPTLLDLFWILTSESSTTFYLKFEEFNVSGPNSTDCVNDYYSNTQLLQQNGVGTLLTTTEIKNACPCVYDRVVVNSGNNTNITSSSDVFCNERAPPHSTLSLPNTIAITIMFISDQNVYGSSTGFNITISVGICTQNPCQNGGTCSESGGAYTCQCISPYTGTNCTKVDSSSSTGCSVSQCQNGGTCQSDGNCMCTDEWSGATCSEKQTGNLGLIIGLSIGIPIAVIGIIIVIIIVLMVIKSTKQRGEVDIKKVKYHDKDEEHPHHQEGVKILDKGSPNQ